MIWNLNSLFEMLVTEFCVHFCSLQLDLSSSANRKAKLPRRQLCKSKSYTAKLPQLLIDMTGVDLDSAFDAPDVDAPAAPKFVDAKLNGFILKNMLKPLVTQLSKLDLVSAENEVPIESFVKP